MNEKQQKQEQRRAEFFARLETLSSGEKTALKRNLGVTLSGAEAKAWDAFYKAVPVLTQWEEEPFFLIACAVCCFSKTTAASQSFIGCLKKMAEESNGIKRRVLALLDTSWDETGYFTGKLARLLRMIRQKGLKPNFESLLCDLLSWGHESRYVQLRWAREFFEILNNEKEEEKNVN